MSHYTTKKAHTQWAHITTKPLIITSNTNLTARCQNQKRQPHHPPSIPSRAPPLVTHRQIIFFSKTKFRSFPRKHRPFHGAAQFESPRKKRGETCPTRRHVIHSQNATCPFPLSLLSCHLLKRQVETAPPLRPPHPSRFSPLIPPFFKNLKKFKNKQIKKFLFYKKENKIIRFSSTIYTLLLKKHFHYLKFFKVHTFMVGICGWHCVQLWFSFIFVGFWREGAKGYLKI